MTFTIVSLETSGLKRSVSAPCNICSSQASKPACPRPRPDAHAHDHGQMQLAEEVQQYLVHGLDHAHEGRQTLFGWQYVCRKLFRGHDNFFTAICARQRQSFLAATWNGPCVAMLPNSILPSLDTSFEPTKHPQCP